jgi:GNAT superfamily N-acetyltransferase
VLSLDLPDRAGVPLYFNLLSPESTIITPELREHYEATDWLKPARCAYIVLAGSSEVAFAGFDLIPEFVLYLLYVLPAYRDRCVGTNTLAFAKGLGRARSARRLLVRPNSLELPKRDVEPFYLKRGFLPTDEDDGLWQCSLTE